MRALFHLAFLFLLGLSAPAVPALAQNAPPPGHPSNPVDAAAGAMRGATPPTLSAPAAPGVPAASAAKPAPDAAAKASGIPVPANLPPEVTGETPPDPMLLPPLKTITERGGRVHYLGQRYGMHGWFITHNGQIQVMYLTPDQQGLVFGAMFGLYSGENVTGDQVKALNDTNSEVRNFLSSSRDLQAEGNQQILEQLPAPQTPGEKLVYDLAGAGGVSIGADTAPLLMMVIDPFCPFCKETWKKLAPSVASGKLQVRLIPVGTADSDNERAAAVLLGSVNAGSDWGSHVDGNADALKGAPRPEMVELVRKNRALMDRWKVPATPYLVYRGRSGQIMIVQGAPEKTDAVLKDLGIL